MGLSRKHLNGAASPVRFEPDELASVLKANLPEAVFCLLMGSAIGGTVATASDLDLAFYLSNRPSLEFYGRVAKAVEIVLPAVRCDTGILNAAEPVYRFEALKGKLLFVRDEERYLSFFSRTCREYESQMADYERQLLYRLEVAHAL